MTDDAISRIKAALDFAGSQGWHPFHCDDIRTLLDRLKDIEQNGAQAVRWAPSSAHWSSELRRLFGDDARDGIGALEQQLRDAKAENERLRESLRGLLAVTSSRAPGTGLIVGAEDRHAAAIKQARAALAQLVADPRDPPDRGGGAGGTGRAA